MIPLLLYVAIFVAAFFIVRLGARKMTERHDFTSLKTVTFGDESAVRPDRWASVISIVTIFLLWGAFTGSKWPMCCPNLIGQRLQGAADGHRRASIRTGQPSVPGNQVDGVPCER